MAMVNPFVKLTIAGGCVLGGVVFPPLLAGAGMGWGAVLATALGNVAAGNAANVVDALLAGEGKVSLENHDLTKAVGKAIAAVITLAALQHQGETGKSLQKIAAHAEKNWVKIAQQELTQQRYPALREAQLDQFLTPEDYHLTQEGNLKWQDWSDIFIRLNMATRKDGGFPLPSNLYEEVAKLLHKTFPQALRETLKEDFAQDGKAFAGLTLQLLTGMKAELAELRNTNPGATPAEYPQIVERFQQLEAQLQGTAAQQQALFNQLSNEITSGFAEVCQQLGVMETHITGLLQNLDDNLVGLRQDVAEVHETLRQGFSQQQGRQISKREFRDRQKVLSEMSIEVEARLNQSLHNAVLLNLGKEQQPHQVERRWDMSVKIGEQKPFQLPSETGILEVFENRSINGNFLILGKPGSGKTTTLLELLRDLVARAENDSYALIPVKLELSEWQILTRRKNKFLPFGEKEKYDPSIKEWVLSQLQRMGVSNEIAEQWLRDKELILLLDGLDELSSERQAKCVRAINDFLESENSPQYLVVCSRKEEYEEYEEKLRLNTAIFLEDLTVEQMQYYFSSVNLGEFWDSIKDSDKIVDFIRQPLFLAITSIAYQQIDVEEWKNCKFEQNSVDYLLGIYRIQCLNQQKTNSKPSMEIKYTNQLIRVASYLKNYNAGIHNNNLKEFCIYEMQIFFLNDVVLEAFNQLLSLTLTIILYSLFLILTLSMGLSGLSNLALINILDFFGSLFIEFIIVLLSIFPGFIFVGNTKNDSDETKLKNKEINKSKFHKLFFIIRDILLIFFGGFLIIQIPLWVFVGPFAGDSATGLVGTWSVWIPRNMAINIILTTWLFVGLYSCSLSVTSPLFTTMQFIKYIKFNPRVFSNLIIHVFIGFIFGLPFAIFLGLLSGDLSLFFMTFFVWTGICFAFHGCQELKPDSNINIDYTSQNVKDSLLSWIFLFIIGLVSGGFYFWVFEYKLMDGFIYGTTVGLIFSLFAMIPVIQYIILRLTLWLTGQMPWNITRFLDYCTDRLILQRVGNRYRFIHRLVQEHFA
ncbi:MAG: NACHT domain-containing protein, partial [Planktothrix sp.]